MFRLKGKQKSLVWNVQIAQNFPDHVDIVKNFMATEDVSYGGRARLNGALYRIIGAVEVILGVTFPLATQLTADFRILSGISVAIALAAGVTTFFAWPQNWQLYRSQTILTDALLARWNLQMTILCRLPGGAERSKEADRVTGELIDDAVASRQELHSNLSDSIRPPEELIEALGKMKNIESPKTPEESE